MALIWHRLAQIVERHGQAALVSVIATAGSAPREAGARMIVQPDGAFFGTVGGGALEWALLDQARKHLASNLPAAISHHALGPELAQCCGGRVSVLIEVFERTDLDALRRLEAAEEAQDGLTTQAQVTGAGRSITRRVVPGPVHEARLEGNLLTEHFADERTQLLLFGAGHVARALVLALAPLPFATRWIDNREGAFPSHVPQNVVPVTTDDPPQAVAEASHGAFVLIMTHSHPLDLAITTAALKRDDLAFVGLIGSATKRARFERLMRDAGLRREALQRLVCPIGIDGVTGKEPAVIAASVTAQLLVVCSAQKGTAYG